MPTTGRASPVDARLTLAPVSRSTHPLHRSRSGSLRHATTSARLLGASLADSILALALALAVCAGITLLALDGPAGHAVLHRISIVLLIGLPAALCVVYTGAAVAYGSRPTPGGRMFGVRIVTCGGPLRRGAMLLRTWLRLVETAWAPVLAVAGDVHHGHPVVPYSIAAACVAAPLLIALLAHRTPADMLAGTRLVRAGQAAP